MSRVDRITVPTHHTYRWSDGSSATYCMSESERRWRARRTSRAHPYLPPPRQDFRSNLVATAPAIAPKTEPADDEGIPWDTEPASAYSMRANEPKSEPVDNDGISEASTDDARLEVRKHFNPACAEDETASQLVNNTLAQCNEENHASAPSMTMAREEAFRPHHPRAHRDALRRSEPQRHPPEVATDPQQSPWPTGRPQRRRRMPPKTPHRMVLRKRDKTPAAQEQSTSHIIKGSNDTSLRVLQLESVSLQGGTIRFTAQVELSLDDIQGIQNRHAAMELVVQEFGRETWNLLCSSSQG